jgi:hypothetical protein
MAEAGTAVGEVASTEEVVVGVISQVAGIVQVGV